MPESKYETKQIFMENIQFPRFAPWSTNERDKNDPVYRWKELDHTEGMRWYNIMPKIDHTDEIMNTCFQLRNYITGEIFDIYAYYSKLYNDSGVNLCMVSVYMGDEYRVHSSTKDYHSFISRDNRYKFDFSDSRTYGPVNPLIDGKIHKFQAFIKNPLTEVYSVSDTTDYNMRNQVCIYGVSTSYNNGYALVTTAQKKEQRDYKFRGTVFRSWYHAPCGIDGRVSMRDIIYDSNDTPKFAYTYYTSPGYRYLVNYHFTATGGNSYDDLYIMPNAIFVNREPKGGYFDVLVNTFHIANGVFCKVKADGTVVLSGSQSALRIMFTVDRVNNTFTIATAHRRIKFTNWMLGVRFVITERDLATTNYANVSIKMTGFGEYQVDFR